ncbi:MAG TPA: peptidase E [bacterium]|jgi:dipeptidase E|nr:peptidase E [bacterium]
MTQKIVAIGGGKIGWGAMPSQVMPISQEIVRLSGKKKPKLVFIPTASSDDKSYARMVQGHFGGKLGCQVDVLYLHKLKPSLIEIRKRILSADIVYVGGGNTLMMMNRWKKLGVDKVLKEAHGKGKVLCGTSAGAICWFRQGNSDSRKYHNPKAGLIKVAGLGFIDALACPHYDAEKDRKPELKKMMKKTAGVSIAMDNCAALEILGDRYRSISSKSTAQAFQVYWHKGRYFQNPIPSGKNWQPLARLNVKISR